MTALAQMDLDHNGLPDMVQAEDRDQDGQTDHYAIYLGNRQPGLDAQGQPIPPDLTRLADISPDLQSQGLLAQISQADLLNTDVYFFRPSNGELVAEKKGLSKHLRSQHGGLLEEETNQFYYRVTVRLPGTRVDYVSEEVDQINSAARIQPTAYQRMADHLRPGETLQVVAINRSTGYIGTAITTVQSATSGLLSFPIPDLVLLPPNLKVRVERDSQVEAGLNQGQKRHYLIGFEGSGLTSDTLVSITTEWFDQDGTMLPEALPGYTGRLAKVVAANQLQAVGGDVAHFEIRTGLHRELIHLPAPEVGPEHYYLQVAGAPPWDSPDFSTLDAGSGPLQYRPQRYTPVKVAIFDEAATLALKTPDPIYHWLYRPEMQFSLFQLTVQTLSQAHDALVIDGTTGQLALDTEETPFYQAGDDTVCDMDCLGLAQRINVLYDLLGPEQAALPEFGPERVLVFAQGAEEAEATLGLDQRLQFQNVAHLRSLDAADFIGMSLFQNSDAANVLWEYAYVRNDDCGDGCDPNAISPLVGNPVNAYTGNNYERQVDYRGPSGLSFVRYYNSLEQIDTQPSLGVGWSHNYSQRLLNPERDASRLRILRPDGRLDTFVKQARDLYTSTNDDNYVLKAPPDNVDQPWVLIHKSGRQEHYNDQGQLVKLQASHGQQTHLGYYRHGKLARITGPFGHQLQFSYDSATGYLSEVTDPAGQKIRYQHSGSGQLVKVTSTDQSAIQYLYENPNFPHHLTGIIDGRGIRYAHYQYNAGGKVILSEHGGGFDAVQLVYTEKGTQVIDASDTTWDYAFTTDEGRHKPTQVSQNGQTRHNTYDAQKRLTRRTDELGRKTDFDYDAYHLIRTIEAADSPQARTTQYQYLNDESDLVTQITRPSVFAGATQHTILQYDAQQNPIKIQQTGYTPPGQPVQRTLTLVYNSDGQLTQIDGPRSDVDDLTTLEYYPNQADQNAKRGQLKALTNALGHKITYHSYDAHGRVQSLTEPNGMLTQYQYDSRGRLTQLSQTPTQGQARISTFQYNGAGDLSQVITPDGVTLSYHYNAARYLTAIQDPLGQRVEYQYDKKGNRIGEKTYGTDQTLVRNIQAVYDAQDRLTQINNGGALTQLVFDAVGNLTQETDPKQNPATQHDYDDLDRLFKTVDRLAGVTNYQYDVNDQLIQVKAPNQATTTYEYDDLGHQLKEVSPDRGTLVYEYDAVGNVIQKIDARGITANYVYDALNRLTSLDLPGTEEDVTFSYDTCQGGLGRLCQIQDQSGMTSYAYDGFGNIVTQTKQELGRTYTTQYQYDNADRMIAMTYPDSRVVNYTRDGLGRTTQVDTTIHGQAQTLVQNIQYRADGLMTAQSFGNGLVDNRTYDLQGRLTRQSLGHLETRDYSYDANGNITAMTGNTKDYAYGYDALDRLVSDQHPLTSLAYTYDAIGNRLSETENSQTKNYTYESNSNRLGTEGGVTYITDVVGNITDNGRGKTFVYNQAGRLSQIIENNTVMATYTYNALGQRTRKVTTDGTVIYHYDLLGNRIAESNAQGQWQRHYLWLNGQPLAQIDQDTTETLRYLHTDHLATARVATNTSGVIVWQWQGEAFGGTAPNEDVDGDGLDTSIDLRFPGQYYDTESGLYYNYYRYYDPGLGRYVTSDPIGLAGGVNTFGYVGGNPLSWSDPKGLVRWTGQQTGGEFLAAGGFSFELTSECVHGKRITIHVVAVGAGLGIGLKSSGTTGSVIFEDPFNFLNPGAFNGDFFFTGAGFSVPPTSEQKLGQIIAGASPNADHGVAASAIQLGVAGSVSTSTVKGIDIGLGFLIGTSTVLDESYEECECD